MKNSCWRNLATLVAAVLVCTTSLFGQQKVSRKMEVTLYFRHDKYVLDESYMSNRATIEKLDTFFERHYDQVDSIEIIAHASPEGTVKYNQKLSERRAGTTKYWLLKNYKSLRLDQIQCEPLGEDYQGLIERIKADKNVPYKKEVLRVLRAKGVHPDKKMRQLMKLRWGHPYAYIRRQHLPWLRTAATCVIYWTENLAQPTPTPRLDIINPSMRLKAWEPEEFKVPTDVARAATERKTIMALKTNLLYDAATVVNFSVEVPVGDNFSLAYNHICPWWLSKDNRYCLQLLAIGGEARWWFAPRPVMPNGRHKGRDRLVGHYLGAYGMSGKFDFQARTWGCYQGEFWSAGLSYGYSMPVGKRSNLEFSFSVGYASIPYRHYVPTEDWQDLIRDRYNAGRLHYFGPTKAEISWVIPITVTKRVEKGGDL